jgi:putative ABC transport system permease protein
MSLALVTLIYEWRRYMAAVIALAFSGMMLLAMFGLFAGIVHSVLATTERSRADLFILPVKVQAMFNSNPRLPERIQPQIFLNRHVVEVRSLEEVPGAWVNGSASGRQVQKFVDVWAVDPIAGAVTLPADYTEQQRIALMEPGAVAVDSSNLVTLGVKLGDKASLNGHTIRVRAILHDYQDVNDIAVVVSRDTLRLLAASGGDSGDTGPLMVRIDDPTRAGQVRDELNAISHGAYRAWTRDEFNQANENAVMSQQIVGVLLLFLTIMATLIGVGITSQTLRGAILSNIREFASLRALGVSIGSLRFIVIELSVWTGIAGIGLAGLMTCLVYMAAAGAGLPLVIRPWPTFSICSMLMVTAVASGILAMGILKRSQPADLLR